jgi:hypothetical protein
VDAPAQIDAWKQSVCIEGAQQAFAHFKMHVPVLECAQVVTGGPPKSKPDRKPEKYMEDAHKGALEIEKICSKDVLFPSIVLGSFLKTCIVLWANGRNL